MIKLYDAAQVVLEEACERFGRSIPEEKDAWFKDKCDLIDGIVSGCDIDSVEIAVDENSMDITVFLNCTDLVSEGEVGKLIAQAVTGFSEVGFRSQEGDLQVRMVASGLLC